MAENWRQKAYEKLLRDGWRRQSAGTVNGECCAGGAIAYGVAGYPRGMYAGPDEPYYDDLAKLVEEFVEFTGLKDVVAEHRQEVGLPTPTGWYLIDYVIYWNDLIATEEEVLEAFRRFAEAEAPQNT